MEHQSRVKSAEHLDLASVPAVDRDALAWLKQRRGLIDFGEPYTIQRFSDTLGVSYQDNVPARPITVSVPVFFGGTECAPQETSGATLREAVEKVQRQIEGCALDTYAEMDRYLGRVLTTVGSAEFRVADLLALIRDYYDNGNPTGGSLHGSLDDGNMDDAQLVFEIDYAKERGDKTAVLIAELLRLVPPAEREALYHRGYGR